MPFGTGKSVSTSFICAANDGEVMVSKRKRSPAPRLAFKPSPSLFNEAANFSDELVHGRVSSR
jgi:hypothetical protein